ncbi:MAG: LptF/LptG family permease [Verrucomicrobiota bacterium]
MTGFSTQRRHRSGLLFRYVSRELLLPFGLCVFGLLGLFLIADALDAQRALTKAGADWQYTAVYLLLCQPLNLVHVLPMSVMLGASVTTSSMGRHHEITAVRSSGISLLQWGRPFWMLGLSATIVTFCLCEFVVPALSVRVQQLRDGPAAAKNSTASDASQRLLAYRNRDGNRDWFFEGFAQTGEGEGVLVKQYRAGGELVWELQARSAHYTEGEWQFQDAVLTRYLMRDGYPQPVRTSQFETYARSELDEPPEAVTGELRPTEDMAVRNMLVMLDEDGAMPERTRDILETTVWYRLAYPWTCLMCALVGVGLNAASARRGALGGFASSVGIIFLFYTVSEFSVLFGRTGHIPAAAAGVVPVVAFLAWAAARVYRNR